MELLSVGLSLPLKPSERLPGGTPLCFAGDLLRCHLDKIMGN